MLAGINFVVCRIRKLQHRRKDLPARVRLVSCQPGRQDLPANASLVNVQPAAGISPPRIFPGRPVSGAGPRGRSVMDGRTDRPRMAGGVHRGGETRGDRPRKRASVRHGSAAAEFGISAGAPRTIINRSYTLELLANVLTDISVVYLTARARCGREKARSQK